MNFVSACRRFIPLGIRQEFKHIQRINRDRKNGTHFDSNVLAIKSTSPIQLIQPIVRGSYYENKIKNISRGCALLSVGSIGKKQNWSFWHSLGRPTKKNGFCKGRNLVNGEISAQIGGGLCQVSSILYHLSLLAGLEIRERHPHSIDIYEEHLRFTPLGADSTVVWGSKDLRLSNPYDFPLSFSLRVQDNHLIGEVHTEQPVQPRKVEFKRIQIEPKLNKVETQVDGIVVATNIYVHKPA